MKINEVTRRIERPGNRDHDPKSMLVKRLQLVGCESNSMRSGKCEIG